MTSRRRRSSTSEVSVMETQELEQGQQEGNEAMSQELETVEFDSGESGFEAETNVSVEVQESVPPAPEPVKVQNQTRLKIYPKKPELPVKQRNTPRFS